jgi:Porin PorA
MKNKILGLSALLFIAAAALWTFTIAPRWTQRLPPGWSWKARSVATIRMPDPKTVGFGTETIAAPQVFEAGITDDSPRPTAVKVRDRYTAYDAATDQVAWEYLFSASVDPETGRHLNPEYRDDYFVFPRNVEKKTYKIRYSFLKGIRVAFQQEEMVGGLNTYVFAFKGDADVTDTYAGTPDFPGIKIEAGQEVRCSDEGFVFKAWVEPLTGEIIKLENSCYSGDYIYDIATGKKLVALQSWGGVTAGDDVTQHVRSLERERSRMLWVSRYVPGLLLLAGLASAGLLLTSVIAVRRRTANIPDIPVTATA